MDFKKLRHIFREVLQTAQDVLRRSSHAPFDPPPGDTALLIINTQQKYCNYQEQLKAPRSNSFTDAAARRIRDMAKLFREEQLPFYMIYTSNTLKAPDEVDFHMVRVHPSIDFILPKTDTSAFHQTVLKEALQDHRRKRLLICGVSLDTDVFATACDARAMGFDVWVLHDMTVNDNSVGLHTNFKLNADKPMKNNYRYQLELRGIRVVEAMAALHDIRCKNPALKSKKSLVKSRMKG